MLLSAIFITKVRSCDFFHNISLVPVRTFLVSTLHCFYQTLLETDRAGVLFEHMMKRLSLNQTFSVQTLLETDRAGFLFEHMVKRLSLNQTFSVLAKPKI